MYNTEIEGMDQGNYRSEIPAPPTPEKDSIWVKMLKMMAGIRDPGKGSGVVPGGEPVPYYPNGTGQEWVPPNDWGRQ